MASPIGPGQVLAGKYRVEGVLGEGGMGVVVAAVHEQLDQRVALKFLLKEVADADTVARFLKEAKAAVRLRSEHVAKVLDVGTLESGAPYMVMEYLEGEDLAGLLARTGKVPVVDAVDYLLQACEAMAEAHRQGIIHRDLKPANLFVTHRPDGSACLKVLDFGISKLLGDQPGSMTQTRSLLGTPYYMAPEQMRSSKNVSAQSDVWALGMVLYELLTGHVAYEQETLPELCMAIIVDPVPPLRDQRADLPAGLEGAVHGALEKDPEVRFQTVADFAAALAPFGSPGAALSAARVSRVLHRMKGEGPAGPTASATPGVSKDAPTVEAPRIDAPDTERAPAPAPAAQDAPSGSPPLEVEHVTPRRSRLLAALLVPAAITLAIVGITVSLRSGEDVMPKSEAEGRDAGKRPSAAPPSSASPAPEAEVAPVATITAPQVEPPPVSAPSAKSPGKPPPATRPLQPRPPEARPQDVFGGRK